MQPFVAEFALVCASGVWFLRIQKIDKSTTSFFSKAALIVR
jgi:hypothetical protein